MQPSSKLASTSSSTPDIPGYISVNNKSLYDDFLSSINYNNAVKNVTNQLQPSQSNKLSNSQRPKTSKNINSNLTQIKKLESKKKKILKYHSELEKWRKNDLKRTLQMMEFKKSRDEAEFRKRLNMIETRGGIYSEVADILYKYDSQHSAKTMNLYSDWHSKVYHPILKHIKTICNDEQYMVNKKNKMRNLYEKYLNECNKNGNKIFLDSINVKEYDPFEWINEDQNPNQQIKKLKKKIKVNDPLKSDLNKYIVEQKISNKTSKYFNNDESQKSDISNEIQSDVTDSRTFCSTNMKSNTFSLKPHTRFCISPVQYNHVSHLPLFRDMQQLQKNKSKSILPSHLPGGNVLLNQHHVPKYNAEIVKKQFFPQSKRIVRPEFTKYEFKISEMW